MCRRSLTDKEHYRSIISQ